MATEGAPGAPRRTSPFVTKYELTKLIGLRMLQLRESHRAESGETLEQVAIRELREGRNPAVIRRHTPLGHEDCKVSCLQFDDDALQYILSEERFTGRGAFGGGG